jgi:hypothetical protein
MISPFMNKDGYPTCSIYPQPGIRKNVFVHTMVLSASVSPRPSDLYSADHINGCRTDNRLCNLEWVPIWENTRRRTERRRSLTSPHATNAHRRKRG